MNRKSDHLTWRQILDLIEGRDSSEPRAEHLRSCAPCGQLAKDARFLSETLHFARTTIPGELEAAEVVSRLDHYGPELVSEIEWARAEADRLSTSALPSPGSTGDSWAARVRSGIARLLEAALVADSWMDQAVAVRGSSNASPRILVYETEDYTVSISLHLGADPQQPEVDLIGQMAPRQGTALPAGIVAHLVTDDGASLDSSVEPYGEFRFETLRSQPASLAIDFGSDRIEIGPFPEVGAF